MSTPAFLSAFTLVEIENFPRPGKGKAMNGGGNREYSNEVQGSIFQRVSNKLGEGGGGYVYLAGKK